MKSYREIADSVFARRDEYVIRQRKKKQAITRATASVGSVALVSLAGFALFKNDAFRETPPLSDGASATTVTDTPTQIGDTTTTTGTAPSKTDPTATIAPSTTAKTEPSETVTQTQPTATQTKPTTSTVPGKVLVVADKVDNTGNFNESEMSINKRYISRRLKEAMTYYEGKNYHEGGDTVIYAVIVSMPAMKEDEEDFWNSNEEWAQLQKNIDEAYTAWRTEAQQVNPSWDGVDSKDIEIWTDTMRANRERWLTLIDERNSISSEYFRPYVQMCINQRFEALKAASSVEPVDVLESSYYTVNAYYVELTADGINALAERGGYTFSLATANQKALSGYWVSVD